MHAQNCVTSIVFLGLLYHSLQVYQERAQAFAEAGEGGLQLHSLQKWIRAAELSGDQAALAQAHMQFGLAQQQQVYIAIGLSA